MTIPTPRPVPRVHALALTFVVIGIVYLVACIVVASLTIAGFAAGGEPVGLGIACIVLFFGWTLLFYPVVLSLFRVAADRRVQVALREHPGAYVMHTVARPSTATQWRAAAHALGVRAGGLPWNNYALVVADSDALRLYAGNITATERVALPTARLVSAVPMPRTVGIRTLHCLMLGVVDPVNQVWTVEVVPMRWSGFLMRAMPPEQLVAELADMQRATHPGL